MGLGWNRTLLRVDLGSGRIEKETLPGSLLQQYLGGEGLGARILYDETGPETEPLAAECPLIFATGPLTGTGIGGGRLSLVTRSCVTGFICSGNMGGHFAPALKYAGYDAVVVTGQSPRPVYLYIDDGKVALRDAGHLWGKDTWETDEALEKECGAGFQKLTIGPGGERLVVSAPVLWNLSHSGGRYGFGAGMGAKRLKAVVARGTGGVELADARAFGRALDEIWRILDPAEDAEAGVFSLYGSSGSVHRYQSLGCLITRNDTAGECEDVSNCTANVFLEKYWVKGKACFGCRWPACMHWVEIKDGPNKGLAFEGIQTGAIVGPGSYLGIFDPEAQIRANILCNRLGICMIGTGPLIGWAIEAFERGALTTADTDGLELRWNRPETALELMRRIAYREGPFADLLASGLGNAARTIGRGTEAYALTIKGQEKSTVAPTPFLQMALGYAVNDRGPVHTHFARWFAPSARSIAPEIRDTLGFDFDRAADRTSPVDKGRFVKWLGDSRAVMNSAIFCLFLGSGSVSVDFRPLARALSAATGEQFTHNSLLEMGERVINLERAYNVRIGATRRDDHLPRRFLEEGYPKGGSAGVVVPLEGMLDDYYQARGWDLDTGIPGDATLRRLGLERESRDIQAAREREAARPTREAERAERDARRESQNALYEERMASSASRAANAMARPAGGTRRVKIRFIASVCVAAGGVGEEDVETRAHTIGDLLAEIRTVRPEVCAMMLDPSGTRIDHRRGVLALVPEGITRPAGLDHPLCDGIEVTLS